MFHRLVVFRRGVLFLAQRIWFFLLFTYCQSDKFVIT
jgi:hypothetical protein